MIYKRLRPRIVILFLLLSVVQMAMAEINDVASVQVEPADQTNAAEETAAAVSRKECSLYEMPGIIKRSTECGFHPY